MFTHIHRQNESEDYFGFQAVSAPVRCFEGDLGAATGLRTGGAEGSGGHGGRLLRAKNKGLSREMQFTEGNDGNKDRSNARRSRQMRSSNRGYLGGERRRVLNIPVKPSDFVLFVSFCAIQLLKICLFPMGPMPEVCDGP